MKRLFRDKYGRPRLGWQIARELGVLVLCFAVIMFVLLLIFGCTFNLHVGGSYYGSDYKPAEEVLETPPATQPAEGVLPR